MKSLFVFVGLFALSWAQELKTEAVVDANTAAVVFDGPEQSSEPMVRNLPADVLRDFTGLCFASTLCRVFEIGQTWPLTPFCGNSTCVLSPEGFLIERVNDCGRVPKTTPKCKITNEDQREQPFPDCCPIYKCEKGVELTYPTPEELAAEAQAQAQAQAEAQGQGQGQGQGAGLPENAGGVEPAQ